jgi:glycosyl transferase family 25
MLKLLLSRNKDVKKELPDYHNLYVKTKCKENFENIIYQTYPKKDLPENMKNINNKMKDINNNYQFVFFDDNDCRNFIETNFKKIILDLYDNILSGTIKADLWKYCILYLNGGIYLDLKFESFNDFKIINLNKNSLVINHTGFIISKPKNNLFINLINSLMNNVSTKNYSILPDQISGLSILDKETNDKDFKVSVDKESITFKGKLVLKYYSNYIKEKYLSLPTNLKFLWYNKSIYKESSYTLDKFKILSTKSNNYLKQKLENNYFNFVDKIVYINLHNRTERRDMIENELSNVISEKYLRFNAVANSYGAIGCLSSHIEVLKMAENNNWKNVLILEDDMKWNNFKENYSSINKLITKNYDVIMLGGTQLIFDKETFRLTNALTSHAYIVNKHYLAKLRGVFESARGMQIFYTNKSTQRIDTKKINKYNLDEYWKKLQKVDNWYIVYPIISIQRDGYSDVANFVRRNWEKEFLSM